MTKLEVISKINLTSVNSTEINKSSVIGWINSIPSANKIKPIEFKIGDVFMHPVFKHPCVLLEKKKEFWLCGILTTESECNEILEICKSRFFNASYFTKVLFTIQNPNDMSFLGVYENNSHIKHILSKLKLIFK